VQTKTKPRAKKFRPKKLKTKSKTNAKTKPAIDVLRADSLAQIPWLVHGFSTRTGGSSRVYSGNSLNLGFTADDSRAAVDKNRRAFASAVTPNKNVMRQASLRLRPEQARPSIWPIVTVRQIHSDLIHCISEIPKHPLAGDGLITNTPGILLAILTADCLPVVLVDTKRQVVSVFHAGWRGTMKRIVEKGLGEMRRCFGSRPADVRAAIGPGIRGCCYEVGPEVRSSFESQFDYAKDLFRETKETNEIHEKYPLLFLTARAPGHSELPKKIFLDLAEANRRQLLNAGVAAKNISDLGLCTFCHVDMFFSHRAEKGKTGRMMAAVGIIG
jgi:YfiH family protein